MTGSWKRRLQPRGQWETVPPPRNWMQSGYMERKTNHISDTPQLIAPVRNVADIIDICAGVKFINYMSESFHGAPPASRLTAQSFYTHTHDRHVTRCIAFGSKCGTLPGLLSGLTTYNVFGSEYTFKIAAKGVPIQGNNVVDVTLGGFAKEPEALNIAVVAASESINEDINPLTSTFKEAVSSRYNFFVKQILMLSTTRKYSDTYESAQRVASPVQPTQPPLPPGPPPPLSPTAHPLPPLPPPHVGVDRLSPRSGCRDGGNGTFCKPKFKSVEDLMFAFSTHVIDSVTGVGRPLSPLEPMLDCSKFQPLVFCSAQPVIVQSPEIDYELDFELV